MRLSRLSIAAAAAVTTLVVATGVAVARHGRSSRGDHRPGAVAATATPTATSVPTATPAPTSPGPTPSKAPIPKPGPGAGWVLRWSPDAARDGLRAFEGVEDDRAGSEPGVKHIYVKDGSFRFDMHLVQRDTSPDRQRNEVKGMNAGGSDLSLGLGETWRLSWSLFIPDSLQATTTFTHIMQLKMPGTGSSPILTMSLRRVGGVPKIEVQINQSGTIVGRADLAPLQNHWVDTAVEFRIGDKPDGYVHWTLTDAGRTAVDVTSTGVDLWMQDRVRPKWGIYRSLGDTSGALRDCYLLLRDMRAYRKQ